MSKQDTYNYAPVSAFEFRPPRQRSSRLPKIALPGALPLGGGAYPGPLREVGGLDDRAVPFENGLGSAPNTTSPHVGPAPKKCSAALQLGVFPQEDPHCSHDVHTPVDDSGKTSYNQTLFADSQPASPVELGDEGAVQLFNPTPCWAHSNLYLEDSDLPAVLHGAGSMEPSLRGELVVSPVC